ncbi:DinB family protein [Dinghuibacter silviterrae]|uniref:Putative damage-inducible protein DinB n=1 Tax=Dinghuibacter silviterrae TaxID=1539049 RepID=A0A4R8DX33_9BACT|nr:DinB family protein [Dinghuibacter silviterrae]TDX01997.1 putative damage-inducible protein DinB [Dinghuibacter silviterrae]
MAQVIITPDAFLDHWQSHRRLTRRVIEAFPEDQLFTYSVGGMRPFSGLALEMIHMARPGIQGFATRQWEGLGSHDRASNPSTKQALLDLWDDTTRLIDTVWPQIPEGRFQETDKIFNAYEGPVYGGLLYLVDNEIHHRGQGYVYLRSLGIEPPAFWDRR